MLLRIGSGGDAIVFLEDVGEMGLIVESHSVGDLCDIDIALLQQPGSLLEAEVTDEVACRHARDLFHLTVELGTAPEGPSGRDAVRFLFSSTGKAPQDLSKVASGGELSRIMLSLKAMMARYTAMPALIFDEIDTGVSGSAADRMGQLICRMGEDMQVFAITHLPQVAAKGNAHYLVTKENDVTDIRLLSREERIHEIARLLSGSVITDAAVANARALLAF